MNIMMITFRNGKIPLVWKYMSFDKIYNLCSKFKDTPLPILAFESERPM